MRVLDFFKRDYMQSSVALHIYLKQTNVGLYFYYYYSFLLHEKVPRNEENYVQKKKKIKSR